ncbi:MAG: D-2-hydroxyacid dehydrogenase [Pseudomonadota bacterium]
MIGARPMRLLLSAVCRERLSERIRALAGSAKLQMVGVEEGGFDWAFVSRDVTGLSTKQDILPETRCFYDALERSPTLRWVHVHSAGADRDIYQRLQERGVELTTSPGTNATIVAQSAVAAILSLARHFPLLREAQALHLWQPLLQTGLPEDLEGQTVTLVGWGPVGQAIARYVEVFGLRVRVVRHRQTTEGCAWPVSTYDKLDEWLPDTDWLVLACPLSPQTQRLVDARRLRLLRHGARVINVSRGSVIDETALVQALRDRHVIGAYLDVFEQEPLSPDSALWDLQNALITPHSAGFSAGNEARVDNVFLQRLAQRLVACRDDQRH